MSMDDQRHAPDHRPTAGGRCVVHRDRRPARRLLRRCARPSSTSPSSSTAPSSSAAYGPQLHEIPYGETISYGELARRVGNPKASRAVGLANGRNPIAIIVPCHRVIGANGKLTGYGGGLDRKTWLLEHEAANLPPGG